MKSLSKWILTSSVLALTFSCQSNRSEDQSKQKEGSKSNQESEKQSHCGCSSESQAKEPTSTSTTEEETSFAPVAPVPEKAATSTPAVHPVVEKMAEKKSETSSGTENTAASEKENVPSSPVVVEQQPLSPAAPVTSMESSTATVEVQSESSMKTSVLDQSSN